MDADLARHRRHLAVPPLAVVSSLTQPAARRVGAPLAHPAPRAARSTRWRSSPASALGTFVLGTALGWLVSQLSNSPAGALRVGARPAAGRARLRHRLRVARAPRLRGPLQTALRSMLGPGAALPNPRAYWGVVRRDDARVLPLRLSAGPHRLPRAGRGHAGDRAQSLGRSRWRAFCQSAADGAPVAGGRHLAGHDGSARGLRYRRRPSATAR